MRSKATIYPDTRKITKAFWQKYFTLFFCNFKTIDVLQNFTKYVKFVNMSIKGILNFNLNILFMVYVPKQKLILLFLFRQ